jgi:hypothetical protein
MHMSINAYRPPDYILPIEREPIRLPIGIGGGEHGSGGISSPYGGATYGCGFPSFDGVCGSLQLPRLPPYGGTGTSAGNVLNGLISFMSGLVGQIGTFLGGSFKGGS